jgi:hypothetical protein
MLTSMNLVRARNIKAYILGTCYLFISYPSPIHLFYKPTIGFYDPHVGPTNSMADLKKIWMKMDGRWKIAFLYIL